MGYEYVISFRKPFVKCTILNCPRKHYAKGYCRRHYHTHCRSVYRYTLKEYQAIKSYQRLKEEDRKNIIKKPEIPIKNKITKELYQKLIEANLIEFKYKDAMNIIDWKYERIKKHILRLVKLGKIIPLESHTGGGSKQANFRVPVTI